MTIAELMLPEFDIEMAKTRKVLELVPADQLNWQADAKLRTIGWVANHIADLVSWTREIIEQADHDINPPDGPAPETPSLEDPADILALFDRNVADARDALEGTTDETMAEDWSLKAGGQTLFTTSKGACLRTWVMNHSIHHRGILTVYLRMVGVELTPVYDG